MERFLGYIMTPEETSIERIVKCNGSEEFSHARIQAGPNGWSIHSGDGVTISEDETYDPEDNFKNAVKFLEGYASVKVESFEEATDSIYEKVKSNHDKAADKCGIDREKYIKDLTKEYLSEIEKI